MKKHLKNFAKLSFIYLGIGAAIGNLMYRLKDLINFMNEE